MGNVTTPLSHFHGILRSRWDEAEEKQTTSSQSNAAATAAAAAAAPRNFPSQSEYANEAGSNPRREGGVKPQPRTISTHNTHGKKKR